MDALTSDRMKELKRCHGIVNDRYFEWKICVENVSAYQYRLDRK